MKKQLSFLFISLCMSVNSFSQNVVVNSNPTMNDRFSKKTGSLRLSSTILKIGRVKSNESRTDSLRIFNDGSREMTIATGKVPSHLRVTIGTGNLQPKAESWIAVTYDASQKNDLGFVLDRIELVTNDSIQPRKSISVTAYISEFFPPINPSDSANIQRARWIETSYDYGSIRQGTKITHNFAVMNEGKQDLYIRKTRSNCGCLKSSASTDTIPPGATGYVTIEFDSYNKDGKDSRKMSVFLNDPAAPEVVLELKGQIEK